MLNVTGGIKSVCRVIETVLSYPAAGEFGVMPHQKRLAASVSDAVQKASDQLIGDSNQSENRLVTSSQEKAKSVGNIS